MGMFIGGPPGLGDAVGDDGGGSNGTTLITPTPDVSADRPTAAATAAAPAKRVMFIPICSRPMPHLFTVLGNAS
jgi:hypothetical protein